MTTPIMTVRFDTTVRVQPRSRAEGMWAFRNKYTNEPPIFTPHRYTYSEAKKWARRWFAAVSDGLILEVCVTAPRPKTHMIEQCWWHLDRKTWLRTWMLTKCGKDRMAGGLLRATRDRAKVDCRICLRRSQSEQGMTPDPETSMILAKAAVWIVGAVLVLTMGAFRS